jgi:nucleotidyltransferase/DNA polymerase involved in DNA repair
MAIACALIPRLSLRSALGGRRELLGEPVALAPQPGGPQVLGEASGAAEAFGVRAGMRLGEALSRCPGLALVPADPVRAEAVWERSLRRLEAIGAAVEPARAGEAFFDTEPLRGLCGGAEVVLARARRELGAGGGARLGAGPNRLSAHAAAMRMRARRPPLVVSEVAARRLVANLSVGALRERLDDEWEQAHVPDTLERLGVRTLGELAALPAEAIADRFGEPGLRALRLARGIDEPLRPRQPHDEIECRLGLPEAASGQQLEHALGLLIERLLAHPARAGRTIRRLRLEARLAGEGGWRSEIVLRSASTSAERLRLALFPRLAELPGPAAWIGLRALELGPEAGEQGMLARSPEEERRSRLAEAVRQARSAAGRDAILRVVEVDPRSRVPERRAILAPFSEERDG